ncbi:MAG: signal peptidase I [Beutenbergiaceae bacterium]
MPGPDDQDPVQAGEADPEPDSAADPRPWWRTLLTFVKEAVIVTVSALVISLVLKTFFIQPFYIPSESMEPVLQDGDRVIVSKMTPGPFDLERGDVVVFLDPGGWLSGDLQPDPTTIQRALTWVGLYPENAGEHLIKRVIGLPGDQVVCCDAAGLVTVNGVSITEPYIIAGADPSEIPFDVVVPEGHLWVMGDNRSRSADSRYNTGSVGGGFIPIDNVVGRAFVIMLPLDRASLIERPEQTFADVPDP